MIVEIQLRAIPGVERVDWQESARRLRQLLSHVATRVTVTNGVGFAGSSPVLHLVRVDGVAIEMRSDRVVLGPVWETSLPAARAGELCHQWRQTIRTQTDAWLVYRRAEAVER